MTAGVKNPSTDIFLGCDSMPTRDQRIGNQDLDSAQHIGNPSQDAPPCSGAPNVVHDTFVPFSRSANANWAQVEDVNTISDNGTEVGWLYLGNDGKPTFNYLHSMKRRLRYGLSVAIGFGIASVSVAQPGAFTKVGPLTVPLTTGWRVNTCFTKGRQLS